MPKYTTRQKKAPESRQSYYESPEKKHGKRKRTADDDADDLDDLAQEYEDQDTKYEKATKKSKKDEVQEEKRFRRFRKHAPSSYLERLERVRTQRMFLIDREKQTSEDGYEFETFDLAGSTGNIYKITIDKEPSCNCPDARKGNQCKHIVYIMVNVLKAPSDLAYQLALLSTELSLILANAPRTPQSSPDGTTTEKDSNRKPVEGDCPVCVMEMEQGEDIVWCKAACGNNIHRQCQEQWAASKPGHPKCVYCRTPWQEEAPDETAIKRLVKSGTGGSVSRDGYVNIAGRLGLSGVRDTSTYHRPWSREYR